MSTAATTPLETMVIEPETAADVAAALKDASDTRRSLIIRGAGTKTGWGRVPTRIDAVLDMRRLNRILAHEHGDLTATIEAGASLGEVNAVLAAHGQALPLDPPFADRATIGGMLATNDSGPLRHRYGTPRDLVIGIQLATTDGVLSKAGGKVVKNVAGYDLAKLVTGSFGSLAAIVTATFKLSPLPVASSTMRIRVTNFAAVGHVVRSMMASQLEPIAFEVASAAGLPLILLRFASLPDVVDAQIAQATAMLNPFTTAINSVDDDAERRLWQAHATEMWEADGAIVRVSWLPANITAALTELERITAALKMRTSAVAGRAAVGAGHVRLDGEVAEQASFIEQLRASPIFGNVVIVRGSIELKGLVDVWGSHGSRQPLFDSLKRAFDPHGVLNAGRGPL